MRWRAEENPVLFAGFAVLYTLLLGFGLPAPRLTPSQNIRPSARRHRTALASGFMSVSKNRFNDNRCFSERTEKLNMATATEIAGADDRGGDHRQPVVAQQRVEARRRVREMPQQNRVVDVRGRSCICQEAQRPVLEGSAEEAVTRAQTEAPPAPKNNA